jgi:hypothetical protein
MNYTIFKITHSNSSEVIFEKEKVLTEEQFFSAINSYVHNLLDKLKEDKEYFLARHKIFCDLVKFTNSHISFASEQLTCALLSQLYTLSTENFCLVLPTDYTVGINDKNSVIFNKSEPDLVVDLEDKKSIIKSNYYFDILMKQACINSVVLFENEKEVSFVSKEKQSYLDILDRRLLNWFRL